MKLAKFASIGVLMAAFAAGSALAAGVIVPAEQRFSPFDTYLPSCDDAGVLDTIRGRFAQKESGYWNSSLEIGEVDRIREIGYRSNGVAYIPRRYCVARAKLSDTHWRTLQYEILSDMGIIGWGYGVEFCVVGLDRNLAYAPACAVLRPFVERRLAETGLSARY